LRLYAASTYRLNPVGRTSVDQVSSIMSDTKPCGLPCSGPGPPDLAASGDLHEFDGEIGHFQKYLVIKITGDTGLVEDKVQDVKIVISDLIQQ
jgi:hypothetical protein